MPALRRAIPAFLLALCLATPSAVPAQTLTGMVHEAMSSDPQLQNASNALETALQGLLTKGETVRGPSGALMSLLTSSDDLICSAWIISFSLRIRELTTANALEGDPQVDRVIQQLKEYRDRIEVACSELPRAAPPPPPAEDPPPQPGGGRTRHGRYTVEEEICMDRCASRYGDYLRAIREAERAQGQAQEARAQARAAGAEAEAAERARSEAEDRHQAAQGQITELSRGGVPNDPGRAARLDAAIAAARSAQQAARSAQQRAAEARRRQAELERRAETLEWHARRLERELEEARGRYLECAQRCVEQARLAGKTVLVENLFRYSEPPEAERDRRRRAGATHSMAPAARWVEGGAGMSVVGLPTCRSFREAPSEFDISCDESGPGLGVRIGGGLMVSPRVAVLAEFAHRGGGGESFEATAGDREFAFAESIGSTSAALRAGLVLPRGRTQVIPALGLAYWSGSIESTLSGGGEPQVFRREVQGWGPMAGVAAWHRVGEVLHLGGDAAVLRLRDGGEDESEGDDFAETEYRLFFGIRLDF